MSVHNNECATVVTVVMIFLNGRQFLTDAVQSVMRQTFTAWELILVDDGSTDGSSEMARQYSARCPGKIRYLEHPGHENRGMSASRNLGIRAGCGRYIALLDCDDVWHEEKLTRQVELLERHPGVAMVYSATVRWFGWTGRQEDSAKDQPRPLGVSPGRIVYPPEMISRFLRDEGQTPATCSVLMRREAVEAVGGFEEEFRSLYEDQAFFYKVLLRHPAFVQTGHWDWYRQHPESCCQVASGGTWLTPRHPAHGHFLAWLQDYLSRTGIQDRTIDVALAQARRPFLHPRRYCLERTIIEAWQRPAGGVKRGWQALADALGTGRYIAFSRLRQMARKILPSTVYRRLRAIRHQRVVEK